MSKYHAQGYVANEHGATKKHNPYPVDTPNHDQWNEGWDEGEASYNRWKKAEDLHWNAADTVTLIVCLIVFVVSLIGLAEFVKLVWEIVKNAG